MEQFLVYSVYLEGSNRFRSAFFRRSFGASFKNINFKIEREKMVENFATIQGIIMLCIHDKPSRNWREKLHPTHNVAIKNLTPILFVKAYGCGKEGFLIRQKIFLFTSFTSCDLFPMHALMHAQGWKLKSEKLLMEVTWGHCDNVNKL